VYGAAALLRGYLRATQRRRRTIVPVWLPGKAARAFRDGANLEVSAGIRKEAKKDLVQKLTNSIEEVSPIG
jgi:hypothetical protein